MKGVAAEMKKQRAADYDGVNGYPCDWMPDGIKVEFVRLRCELLAKVSQLQARRWVQQQSARIRAEQDALRELQGAALQREFNLAAQLAAPIPPRLMRTVSRLALIHYAASFPRKDGLRVLIGKDAAKVKGAMISAAKRQAKAADKEKVILAEAEQVRAFDKRPIWRVAESVAKNLRLKPERVRRVLRRNRNKT